jgi:hypothetical protein
MFSNKEDTVSTIHVKEVADMNERNLRSSGGQKPAMLLMVLLSLFSVAGIQKQQEGAPPPPAANPKSGVRVAQPVTMPALVPDKPESTQQNVKSARRIAVELKEVLPVVLPISSSATSPSLLPSDVLLPERPRIAVEVFYQLMPASVDTKDGKKP